MPGSLTGPHSQPGCSKSKALEAKVSTQKGTRGSGWSRGQPPSRSSAFVIFRPQTFVRIVRRFPKANPHRPTGGLSLHAGQDHRPPDGSSDTYTLLDTESSIVTWAAGGIVKPELQSLRGQPPGSRASGTCSLAPGRFSLGIQSSPSSPLGLQGDPTSPSLRRSVLCVH